MKEIKLLLAEITQNPSRQILELKESQLKGAINEIIQKIKICKSVVEADAFFDELFAIQDVLAELLFVHHITMMPSLRKFIRDCERLDDPWLREYLFNEIKHDRYSLEH